ncbi:cytochrome C [Rhodobacteraceae bacterium]|nr:cytochrome C [Paracoccaceae bacterium]
MQISFRATLAAIALATPVAAQDIEAGSAAFGKCKACHAITATDGTSIVRGGKVGPNLYGIVGRPVASQNGFRYREALKDVGASGQVWSAPELIAYITDPSAWLKQKTGDANARTGMTIRQSDHQADIIAYIESVSK